jgi:hypothetical protein
MSENDMIGSWWQVNASDFDTSTYSTYSRDIGYHGVESRIRIGAAQNCARNADLFFDAGALSAGAIAGIVIGCVFGKKYVLSYPLEVEDNLRSLFLVTLHPLQILNQILIRRWCVDSIDYHMYMLQAKLVYWIWRSSSRRLDYTPLRIWSIAPHLWRRLLLNHTHAVYYLQNAK